MVVEMSRSPSTGTRPDARIAPSTSATTSTSAAGAASLAQQGSASIAAPGTYGRVTAWLAKHVEVTLATIDLTLPQYRVLGLLEEGSAVASALAERLAVRPPSISAVVDGLCVRGLIVRGAVGDDRRRVPLALTSDGVTLLRVADRAIDERLVAIASSLPDQVPTQALNGLQLWGDALAEHHRQKHEAR
jgi:DNA-binding MarR family transcriptional regulator